MALELLLKVAVAYLLGSISGSLIVGRLRGVDIRQQGSGNAGGTNAFRTQGVLFALPVVLIDIGKGLLATGLVPGLPPSGTVDLAFLQACCGVAVILGHMYPVFFGFRGGKGAAAFVGAAAMILPAAVAPVLGVWVFVLIMSGYVGLATMLASASFVIFCLVLAPREAWPTLLPFALGGLALIVFAHRSNIARLSQGTENRFEKIRIANWRR